METTRDRLLLATLELICENGYRGATTLAIAERAGVSEMTLFRHFGSKAKLVEAALERATEPFRAGAAEPTEDLQGDLLRLATGYVAFVDRWPLLVHRVLPELSGDSELGHRARSLVRGNAKRVLDLLAHHVRAGRLRPDPIERLTLAFIGPLLSRASLAAVLQVGPFDAAAHVRGFLRGHALQENQ